MKNINKILLPIDFSEKSERLIESAKSVVTVYQAKVIVVYVAQDLAPYTGFAIPHISLDLLGDGILRDAERKMDEFLDRHFGNAAHVSGKVLKGNPPDEIVTFARDKSIDLIIMGTHGYRGVERLLLGSVAEKVLKMAPCPVLTINTLN